MKNLLEKNLDKEYHANEGFVKYIVGFIGIMIVIIIAVSVVIPTVNTAIDDANLSGTTTGTLLELTPVLLSAVLILLIVGMMAV